MGTPRSVGRPPLSQSVVTLSVSLYLSFFYLSLLISVSFPLLLPPPPPPPPPPPSSSTHYHPSIAVVIVIVVAVVIRVMKV